MAIIKSPTASVTPVGGQGISGKTRHSNALQVTIPAGTIANGDTMIVAHLPMNARLLDLTIKNDSGVSLTFSLGTAAVPALHRASAVLANGAVAKGLPDAAMFDRSILYPTTPCVATFGAGATIPAGANLKIAYEYLVDEPFLPATAA